MNNMKAVGALRILVALAILGSITWQITDRLAHGLFRPTEYFSYFSIQTSLIAGATLLWTGVTSWSGRAESKAQVIVRLAATACYILVSLAYNLLLRGTANDPRDGNYDWPVLPNEIIHVWAPLALTVGWLLVQGQVRLKLRAALWVAVYPLAWLIFSVLRGLATGWWPYWFIDPTGDGGVAGMFTYIGAITVFLILLGIILIALSRLPISRLILRTRREAN
jgi:hypothetical protein